MTLKKQSSQITLQAQQERENFQREKNNLLIMLQKVRKSSAFPPSKRLFLRKLKSVCCLQEREKLSSLEGKYAELSEGQSFTSNPVTIKEVGLDYRNTTAILYLNWRLSSLICVIQHLHSLKERRRSCKDISSHPTESVPLRRSQQLLSSYGRSIGRSLPSKVSSFRISQNKESNLK